MSLPTRFVMSPCLCCRYIHDDSETTEDEVALKVTDGLNSADVVLHVQVSLLLVMWSQSGIT